LDSSKLLHYWYGHQNREFQRAPSSDYRLRGSNAALTDAAEEINTGVIGADEVYGTVHGLGCDWETLMVVHVEGVSLEDWRRRP
jgi:hypothetical protein